jgi:hypothetical protein
MSSRLAAFVAAVSLAALVDIWAVAGDNARELGARGVRATATVTSLDDPYSGVNYPDGPPVVQYRFQVRGRRYDGLSRIGRGRFFHLTLGGRIEIAYLPDRPQVNTIPGEEASASRLVVLAIISLANGLAVLALLFAAVPAIRDRQREVRSQRLVEIPKLGRPQRRRGTKDARHRR